MPVRPPWYADGLCFECLPDCGACCTNHGDHAYVYLESQDIERLVRYLGVPEEEFRRRYAGEDEGHTILRMDRPECPFLDAHRCSVYEARPTQCRTFPFWRENLRSPSAWREVGGFCPGIDRGPRHPLHVIRERLALRAESD